MPWPFEPAVRGSETFANREFLATESLTAALLNIGFGHTVVVVVVVLEVVVVLVAVVVVVVLVVHSSSSL